MRLVIQKVSSARVLVEGKSIAQIGRGFVLLIGIAPPDTEQQVEYLVEKVIHLRIFEDAEDKMNLSLLDVHGEALVVSQFTLYANTHKGRRPSFTEAALPEIAEPLVKRFADGLQEAGIPTQSGQFGAHMLVEIQNDGPVTIIMESKGDS